jgi:uncharacterized protein
MSSLIYSFSGFAVGLLVGFTGVGGGSLMTPLLILLFSIHPASAVGSDLLYASATKAVGTCVHGLSGSVNWRVTGLLAAGSVPTTLITIILSAVYKVGSAGDSHFVTVALGLVLILTALLVVFQTSVVRIMSAFLGKAGETRIAALTILTGAILGALVTLTSVGAGAIGVTALLILYPTLPAVRLVGSDIAHAVPLTLLAGIGHWWLGDVNFGLVGSLLTGSIPGVIIGSLLSFKISDRTHRMGLAAVLLLVGLRLVT